MADDNIRNVLCPTCQKDSLYHQDNPNRPFCSERCRLIDLGQWADEGHRIPGQPAPPDFDTSMETH